MAEKQAKREGESNSPETVASAESSSDSSSESAGSVVYPELLICLAAAAGTDTGLVTDALAAELRDVGYVPVPIRLSQLMSELSGFEFMKEIQEEDRRISLGMKAGNSIRRQVDLNDAVARLALIPILEKREEINSDETVQAEKHCFIVSSLKREEELETIRTLFGSRAFLISVYEPREERIQSLCKKIAKTRKSSNPEDFESVAKELIDTDQKERDDIYGQRLEDVFPLADVFVKAGEGLRKEVRRFIQLLFRAPYITPTVDEFLMFHAKASSLRSADLSRQVGAVIAKKSGEILATGCNEVPRARGGINWDKVAGSTQDYRDYKLGQDAAAAAKKEIVANALAALKDAGWLQPKLRKMDSNELAQLALYSEEAAFAGKKAKPLAKTTVADLLEFGRIVHAEMAAISDAAMRGIGVQGATLYCTTFPCHMCARHIIASGIHRVVYIEPYPKSRAKKLYKRAICVDEKDEADRDAVCFQAFVGVAPPRFLDLFEMVERKDEQGYALSECAPCGSPKGVTSGLLVSELESGYLEIIKKNDSWNVEGLGST